MPENILKCLLSSICFPGLRGSGFSIFGKNSVFFRDHQVHPAVKGGCGDGVADQLFSAQDSPKRGGEGEVPVIISPSVPQPGTLPAAGDAGHHRQVDVLGLNLLAVSLWLQNVTGTFLQIFKSRDL